MTDTELLNRPLLLPCGAQLPNRLVKSAMSEHLADPEINAPNERYVRLYERLGRGGTGMHITGNVILDRNGRTEPGNVIIVPGQHEAEFKAWSRAAKAHGAHIWMQINHAGRQALRSTTRHPVAPSAVPLKGMAGMSSVPRPLTSLEIETLIERFAAAAAMAKATGFDGVQIHGAHGYLVSQFLSPLANQRTDEWGGSLDGRLKFLLSIVRKVRQAVGKDFPVGLKINSADFQRGGFDTEDLLRVAQSLEAEGLDLLELSGGSYERPAMMSTQRASTRAREAYFLEYAERVREAVRTPLLLTGGFRSREGMAAALRSGAVDAIGVARPLAVDPDFAKKILSGAIDAAPEINLQVGVQLFDGLVQINWYGRQLERMADGLEPDRHLGRWSTVLHSLVEIQANVWRTAFSAGNVTKQSA